MEALFTLGQLDEHAAQTWVDAPPPAVAAIEECPRSPIAPPGAGVRVEMLDMVDQRLDQDSFRHPDRPSRQLRGHDRRLG